MTTNSDSQPSGQAAASAAAAPKTAESDLDGLLREFEKGTAAKPAATTVPTDVVSKLIKQIEPLVNYVQNDALTKAQAKNAGDLDDFVTFIKKTDGLPNLPNRVVRGFLRDWADDHPELAEAWEQRDKVPAAFNAQREKVRDAFVETMKETPANQVRSEIEAASAAVRNQSTTAAPPKEFDAIAAAQMSPRDWRAYMDRWVAGKS